MTDRPAPPASPVAPAAAPAPAASLSPVEIAAQTSAALARIAARIVPGATGVERVARLSGGASQETWSFAVVAPEGTTRWIMRRQPLAAVGERSTLSCGLDVEAKLVGLAREAGVPVPRIACELRPGDGLGDGFVSEHVDGETLARRILREDAFARARPKLARQVGEALAKIHSIAPGRLPALRRAPAEGEVAAYRARYASYGTPKPVFELALKWLESNLPSNSGPLALVHGDFRHGNFIIGPDGLRAVIDWELAHLGDPMEDLGWICVNSWRYGYPLPVGGFGTREELFAGYEAAGGRRVDRAAVHFWELLGTLKWGLMCDGMGMAFKTGAERTLERAAVGRRASEAEIDVMQLLAPRNGG